MNVHELSLETPQSLLVNWKIPLFFHLSSHNACWLQSPDIHFGGHAYHLRLFPEWGYFGIVLENATDTAPVHDVSYEIGLKTRTGKEIEIDRRSVSRKNLYYFPRWELEKERRVYFSDGNITVFCYMRLREPSRDENPTDDEAQVRQIQDFSVVLNFPCHFSFQLAGELSFESPQSLHVTWKIPNFLEMTEQSEYFQKSPEFSFGDDRYCLRLFPSRWFGHTCSSFKLVNVVDSLPATDVSFEVGLKSSFGREIDINRNKPSGQLTLTQPVPSLGQLLLDREFFIDVWCTPEEKRRSFFPDGTVTVFCSMRLREPNRAGDESSDEEEQEGLPGMAKLRSDYRVLLEKRFESDVCLVVRGREFPAHKNILRARSHIFDSMFSHEMSERETGRVVIDDLDPENFGDFLEYLYTGDIRAGLSDTNVFGLYKAAHKYEMTTLMSACVSHMRRNMSVEFFCEATTLAVLHNEKKLLQKAIRFFKRNISRIIVTVKWQQFLIENGTTANELLIKAHPPPNQ